MLGIISIPTFVMHALLIASTAPVLLSALLAILATTSVLLMLPVIFVKTALRVVRIVLQQLSAKTAPKATINRKANVSSVDRLVVAARVPAIAQHAVGLITTKMVFAISVPVSALNALAQQNVWDALLICL